MQAKKKEKKKKEKNTFGDKKPEAPEADKRMNFMK